MKLALKKIGVFGLSAVMAVSMSTAAFAASVGHTLDVTQKLAESTFEYGRMGYTLGNRIDYTEVHETTGHVYSNFVIDVKTGSYTSVTVFKVADEGYNFTEAKSTATVNGAEYSVLTEKLP